MRILWDLRLFSLPYAKRGGGVVTRRMSRVLRDKMDEHLVYILGNPSDIPPQSLPTNYKFVKYEKYSWKKDLFFIPFIIIRYKIRLCHFWLSLGPIHRIGLPLILPCRAIATVLDLGVALWKDIPFLSSKRKTWYWAIQKFCAKRFHAVHFYSEAARNDYFSIFGCSQKTIITYPPFPVWSNKPAEKRKPYILALGGAPHKNLKRTIQAFERLPLEYSEFFLLLAGEIKQEEIPQPACARIRFVKMKDFPTLLSESCAFVSASYHEGFGLPMLEAMYLHCPLVLSSIPSHMEIAGEAAVFVDPFSVASIQDGIKKVLSRTNFWVEKSRKAGCSYAKYAQHSPGALAGFYKEVSRA